MKCFLLLFLFPLQLFSQDITGTWKGTISTADKELPYEIAISDSSGILSGFSYTAFKVDGKKMVTVKAVKIINNNGNISVEDNGLVFDQFTDESARRVRQSDKLTLKDANGKLTMTGKFSTKKTRDFRAMEGFIFLQKQDTVSETQLVPKLQELKLAESLSFMQPGKPEIVASVKLMQPSKREIPVTTVIPVATSVARAPVIKTESKIPELPAQPKLVAVAKPIPDTVKTIAAAKPLLPKVVATTAAPVVKTRPTVMVVSPGLVIAAKPAEKKEATVASTRPAATAPIVKAAPVKPSTPQPVTIAAVPKPTPKPVVVAAPTPDFTSKLAGRTIETIQTVYFKTDSLMLTLYDNGEVDGDTVSIILNGRMIMEKQGLSTKAISKTIYPDPAMGDSLQMVMYAENLGSLPPNTGLLIVKDGNDRYEIRFAGDLKKNAAIIFRRRR